jgi:D-serine deaminase-like pyridoxal phosphate-dependent protein
VSWYTVADVSEIATPALLVYPDRADRNVRRAIDIIGDVRRLRPHLKTSKLPQIVRLHLDHGVTAFKVATVAEAEMAAAAGAADVLLAYQPVGPNVARLARLAQAFAGTRFSAIADDAGAIAALSDAAVAAGVTIPLYLDVDGGMHRTGVAPGPGAVALYRALATAPGLLAAGLHMYDGHVRGADVDARRRAADEAFAAVQALREALAAAGLAVPAIVAGGTPTFPFHARRPGVECSPGTTVFWDAGYGATLPDLPFEPAIALLARVVSRPTGSRLCLDLGHKAVEATAVGHSEEHLVLETARAADFPVGTPVYGVPWHVCPTVALHAEAVVVSDGRASARWPIVARARTLTI